MKRKILVVGVVLFVLLLAGCGGNQNKLKKSPCACNEILKNEIV